MMNEKRDILPDILKHTFSLKRTKFTLYIAAVLWLAVVTQIVVTRVFQEKFEITEAFVKTKTEEMQSSLEVVAKYKSGFMSEDDKNQLLHRLADSIGLTVEDEISSWEEDGRSEYYIYKKAKEAATEIKLVSMEKEEDNTAKINHYIIVRLNILKGIQSIDRYKDILEKELRDLKVEDQQITLKFEGNRVGDLTTQQKHDLAVLLVDELQGEIALEYDEGDIYTVYGYTGMLNEYITSMDNKINIQIAITYNELTNKTRISLATPIMNESW